MHKVLAMVLAGGRGKRMDILCHNRPKPVLPFAGRFRVIDFSLSNCVHSKIDTIALLADYQRYSLADYVTRWNLSNDAVGNLHILEPLTGSYRGTADAVYQNLGYVQRHGADRVVVLAGDHVYRMDYRKMLAFHEQAGADVTVGVVQVPMDQAHRFGSVTLDGQGRITEFVEKSGIPRSNLVSMGMYIFNSDVLSKRLAEDARANSPHDFGYAVIPGMVKKDRVFAFKFDGYWQDIGTIEAYYAANMELTREKPSFSLDGTWPILTGDQSPVSPKIAQQGSVRNSIVGPGCVVKGRVENSILSPGVWVDEQAVVLNSVIMPNVFVGYHSVVDHCVLDEEVNIGKLCYVGFRGGMVSQSHDITVLGQGATVPAHTAIGSNCRVLPHVGVADFNASMIAPGAVISPRAAGKTSLVEEKVAIS